MDLKYTITTAADLAGAQAAQAVLERQIATAKALGEDYSQLQARYNAVTAAINDYTAAAAKKQAIEEKTAASLSAGQQARAKINQEIADSVHTVSQEEIAAATATGIAGETAKIAGTKWTELRHAMHALALEFPILGSLARTVTSSVGVAFGAVAAAIGVWVEKMRAAKQETANWEMPDFKLEEISKATQAWNGLADARQKANDAFNAGDATYNRAIANLRTMLELQKQQLAAEKSQALARLESQKGSMPPQDYEAARKQIEEVFAGAERKATQEERQQEIARKYEEKANYEIEARNKAAAAAKLPQVSPEKSKAEQDALQKALDEVKQKIAAQEKNVEFLRNYNQLSEHVVKNLFTKEGIAAGWEGGIKYGGLTDFHAQQKLEEDQLRDMEGRQKWIQNLMDRRAKQIAERDRLREEAAAAAGKAQTIADELPGDVDMNNRRAAAENQNAATAGNVPMSPKVAATNVEAHKLVDQYLAGFNDVHTTLTAHDAQMADLAQKLKALAARSHNQLTP